MSDRPSEHFPLALLGHPVAHSLSPLIHQTALDAAGLSGSYVACPVAPGRLGGAVRGLSALGFRGANVTIPHKEAALSFCDALSPAAQEIGAVNTLTLLEDGTVTGDNTDAYGFERPLADAFPEGAALVLGAGGAARAVVHALVNRPEVTALWISARRTEQAEQLLESLGVDAQAVRWDDRHRRARQAALVVNATPFGAGTLSEESALEPDFAGEGQTVYDLIYRPAWTPLLRNAADRGASVAGGLEMLIHQAARAFELWTGRAMNIMAVRSALESRGFTAPRSS